MKLNLLAASFLVMASLWALEEVDQILSLPSSLEPVQSLFFFL